MARSGTPGQKTHETNSRFSGYLVRMNRMAFVVTYLAGVAAAVILSQTRFDGDLDLPPI